VLAHGLAQRRPIVELDLPDLLEHRHAAGAVVTALRKIGIPVCLAGVNDTPVALELASELHPPLVKLAATAATELKPERLSALVQRLIHGGAEVIACGIDSPALVAPIWASGVGYAQGAVIQAPQPKPVFDWGEAAG
jgi:EAL domain-containing protein (putative c-di-GMP-specific phosphodiesterase class I)